MMITFSFCTLIFTFFLFAEVQGQIEFIGSIKVRQEKCLFRVKYGPCKGHYPMFAYDIWRNQCLMFLYSGCGGNPNKFYTENECESTCYVNVTGALDEE